MEKKINYLARDFKSIKEELINFSKKYYPEISNNLDDGSVGSWFIDLLSAVGDDLSYHTDRMYQETNFDTAMLRSTVLNVARANGVKIPGPKCSVCEVELSVYIPVTYGENNSSPNWNYAPLIKRGSCVGNMKYIFEIMEDVDFASQFNADGVSNRTFSPMQNSSGTIVQYKVTKTALCYGGSSKIYTYPLTSDDVYPFMEVILPEQDICNVESIIFKENSESDEIPDMFEFFIDEEEYRILNQDISTYRYFEVDSLSDQYRFGTKTSFVERNKYDKDYVVDISSPFVYEDYTETSENGQSSGRTSRYYHGIWKPISQKFITEYTDNNYLKIIFGPGTDVTEEYLQGSKHSQYVSSKIINNHMLGLLPKVGWTMYVLYRTGGGVGANLSKGSINRMLKTNVVFPNEDGALQTEVKNAIIKSIDVINKVRTVGGKDAPSTEEIKFMTKYHIASQNRCVTLKDYKAKLMQIPPKYGCPFRCNVAEDNNKIVLSVLTVDQNGQLSSILPEIMANNIIEYLSHYKTLGDYIELRSGKIFNLGFEINVFIDKNYIPTDVISKIINTVEDYFDINKHDMGADIFIGDLEKEITLINGVISLIEMRVYSLYGGIYSPTPCALPIRDLSSDSCNTSVYKSHFQVGTDSEAVEIDLSQTDSVLYNDIDSMFEIKNPQTNIQVKVKMR